MKFHENGLLEIACLEPFRGYLAANLGLFSHLFVTVISVASVVDPVGIVKLYLCMLGVAASM